jgi:hypothetical protein
MALNVRILIEDDQDPGYVKELPLLDPDTVGYAQDIDIEPTNEQGVFKISLTAFTHGMIYHQPERRTPIDELTPPPATARVRAWDVGLSWDAAVSILPEKAQRMYLAIYGILKLEGPMTDHEIRDLMTKKNFKHSYSGVSARRVELERAGWVRKTGETRITVNGHQAAVYEAVEADLS